MDLSGNGDCMGARIRNTFLVGYTFATLFEKLGNSLKSVYRSRSPEQC